VSCVSHPNAAATRQCTRCQRLWCPLCVKQLNAAGKLLEVCAKCNGPLKEPVISTARPDFALGDLLARPFSVEGLITAAALASPIFVASIFRALPGLGSFAALLSLIYYGTLVGYYFQIIAHIGDDGAGLPGPSDLVDDAPSLFMMSLRGWICVLVGSAPYLIWMFWLRDQNVPPDPRVMVLTLLVGLTYVPAVLVTVVLTNSTLGALYPVAWVQVIARAPRSYAQLVGLFLLALVAFAVANLLSVALAVVPIVGGYLAATLSTLLWMAQAALVGGFLRRHAQDFGYA
jgi:hypothetical protein